MRQHTLVWSSLLYPGMEYLTLNADGSSIEASGVVIGVEASVPFRLDYHLYSGPRYELRSLDAMVVGQGTLQIKSDGQGNWFGGDGAPLPELAGCIDIDLSATPFTNTLPIKRLDWQIGQAREFKMVFITLPTLAVTIEPQRYTCLDQSATGATFHFEALSSDFSAVLPVDTSGLILDYPGLFQRIWPV